MASRSVGWNRPSFRLVITIPKQVVLTGLWINYAIHNRVATTTTPRGWKPLGQRIAHASTHVCADRKCEWVHETYIYSHEQRWVTALIFACQLEHQSVFNFLIHTYAAMGERTHTAPCKITTRKNDNQSVAFLRLNLGVRIWDQVLGAAFSAFLRLKAADICTVRSLPLRNYIPPLHTSECETFWTFRQRCLRLWQAVLCIYGDKFVCTLQLAMHTYAQAHNKGEKNIYAWSGSRHNVLQSRLGSHTCPQTRRPDCCVHVPVCVCVCTRARWRFGAAPFSQIKFHETWSESSIEIEQKSTHGTAIDRVP